MKIILCHPDNTELLRKQFPAQHRVYGAYGGIEIRSDINIPRFSQKWAFPETRFVTYEKGDELWAIPLNFGKWVDGDEPVFYEINDTYFPIFKPITHLFL